MRIPIYLCIGLLLSLGIYNRYLRPERFEKTNLFQLRRETFE